MGFPQWTLLGMGLSAAGALLALALALLGQSPQVTKRSGLSRARLDLRVRAFTSYAFALLLLAIGFFLAGVPLGPRSDVESLSNDLTPPGTIPTNSAEAGPGESIAGATEVPSPSVTPATPETGAFGGPPASPEISEEATPEGGLTISPTTTITNALPVASSPTAAPSPTPTATKLPTATATPIPTNTPMPTLTPTPISGKTAVVNSGGSTLWIRRSPGGQNLVLVQDNDIVLVLPGHANQGGSLWQEVSTLDGFSGWLLEEFLTGVE